MRFLITGASSQIGFAICRTLYSQGHELIVTTSQESSMIDLCKKLDENQIEAETLIFNFNQCEDSNERLNTLCKKSIDGLILNACEKVLRLKRFGDIKLEDSLHYIEKNLRGNLFLLHRILKEQMKTNLGRNVFISSISATMGTSRYASYCLLKSGMEGLFRNLAVDYGSKNLFFNSLRPGIIETERHSKIRSRKGYEENIIQRIPASKLGLPDQVAQALLPLVSQNSYINGTELTVSGGLPLFRTDV